MGIRHAFAVFAVVSLFLALPVVQASSSVESRISSAVEWIREQQVSSYPFAGFVAGPNAPWNTTLYLEDQALVALALSDYHYTHNDPRYDDLLKVAVNFMMQARSTSGKFYEYYDLMNHQWVHVGGLYPWDAYALASLAMSAYRVSSKSPDQRAYWSSIESQLKVIITNLISNQRSDGAWVFRSYTTGKREALTAENALMLAGLSYIGLFEHDWGSVQQMSYYAKLSEKTAAWLFSKQISNDTLAGYGGFPHSDLNSTQASEDNAIVLLGVNWYYTILSLLDPQASPSIWDARTVMVEWVAGFVRKMRDSYGGPYLSRDSSSVQEYPKKTLAASWMLQALADIWVNLGGDDYYSDSQKPYEWIVGGNELGVDMQTEPGRTGAALGFSNAILPGHVQRNARTSIAAVAVFGFVEAAFIQVPEFPRTLQGVVLFLALISITVVMGRRRKRVQAAFAV